MTKRDTEERSNAPDLLAPEALDALFAAAKATEVTEPTENGTEMTARAHSERAPVEVPADLMARVLADARALQPKPAAAAPIWQGVRETLGGWFGLGGLAAAGVAGLVIGLTGVSGMGASLSDSVAIITQDASAELAFDPAEMFDVSLLLEEGGT